MEDNTVPVVRLKGGAVRGSDEKLYHLISPIALEALCKALAEGKDKYGDYNWELGITVTNTLNHALGHIFAFLSGDRTEDNLGKAFCNLMFAIHSYKKWPHLNTDLREEGCNIPIEFKEKYQKERGNA